MIPIQNIYYMLSYAFQSLREQEYRNLSIEPFQNATDLFAAILIQGINTQIKRGLHKDYQTVTEPLSALRGRIDLSASIKSRSMLRQQMVCTFDRFTMDTELNRILKTTLLHLLHANIEKKRKKALRELLPFFQDTQTIDLRQVNWHKTYNRNNQTYQMLIGICHLIAKGMLHTQQDGQTRLMNFLDEQRMCRLYEKFLLAYFQREHPELTARAAQIPWQLDDDFDSLLPVMQTDIQLSRGSRVLIIDAKYYAHTTQTYLNVHTLHSSNLYQIFTYVKNKDAALQDMEHTVSGMLLYARTDEELFPCGTYRMSGNVITVRTLDLNCDFGMIREQLDEIAGTI